VQVARIEVVGVDQTEVADAGAREVLQHRTSEAARPDDQHAASRERCLSGSANLFQQPLRE